MVYGSLSDSCRTNVYTWLGRPYSLARRRYSARPAGRPACRPSGGRRSPDKAARIRFRSTPFGLERIGQNRQHASLRLLVLRGDSQGVPSEVSAHTAGVPQEQPATTAPFDDETCSRSVLR